MKLISGMLSTRYQLQTQKILHQVTQTWSPAATWQTHGDGCQKVIEDEWWRSIWFPFDTSTVLLTIETWFAPCLPLLSPHLAFRFTPTQHSVRLFSKSNIWPSTIWQILGGNLLRERMRVKGTWKMQCVDGGHLYEVSDIYHRCNSVLIGPGRPVTSTPNLWEVPWNYSPATSKTPDSLRLRCSIQTAWQGSFQDKKKNKQTKKKTAMLLKGILFCGYRWPGYCHWFITYLILITFLMKVLVTIK